MSTLFARPSRRQLLADNQQLRVHLFDLGAVAERYQQSVIDLNEANTHTAISTNPAPAPAHLGSLADQPLLLPTDVVQARIELGLVRADRARVEKVNDRLRVQVRGLTDELRAARLAILEPHDLQDMVVPWQPLSSAA